MEGTPKAPDERLPTVEVPNTVIWVNEELRAPLDLQVAKHSPFGIQVDLRGTGTGFPGHAREFHARTLDIGKAYFEDKHHRLYRDIDVKGSGLLSSTMTPQQWFARVDADDNPTDDLRGLIDKDWALKDAYYAEEFTKIGMRTHRAIAVIALDALPVQDRLVSISQLKKQDRLLPEEFNPVIELRAFGVKTRVGDVFSINRDARISHTDYMARLASKAATGQLLSHEQILDARAHVEDALQFLVLEQHVSFSKEEYVHWLIQEIGRNAGLLHNSGCVLRWMHSQNVTLDGRIIDFESVWRLSDLETHPSLSSSEIKEEQEALLYRDINFDQVRNIGILAWLQPLVLYLKHLYPEELKSVDLATVHSEFTTNYLKQIQNPVIRQWAVSFAKEEGLPVP